MVFDNGMARDEREIAIGSVYEFYIELVEAVRECDDQRIGGYLVRPVFKPQSFRAVRESNSYRRSGIVERSAEAIFAWVASSCPPCGVKVGRQELEIYTGILYQTEM